MLEEKRREDGSERTGRKDQLIESAPKAFQAKSETEGV